MDQLEQQILSELSNFLKAKNPIVQEAKEDWLTTQETIAYLEFFSPTSYPLINKRSYVPTRGKSRHYTQNVKELTKQSYVNLERLTRGEFINKIPGVLPKKLVEYWAEQEEKTFKKYQLDRRNNFLSLYNALDQHAKNCLNYEQSKCIHGIFDQKIFKILRDGYPSEALKLMSDLERSLRSAIKYVGTPRGCTLNAVEYLEAAYAFLSGGDGENESDKNLKDSLVALNNAQDHFYNQKLSPEDIEIIKQTDVIKKIERSEKIFDEYDPILDAGPVLVSMPRKIEFQLLLNILKRVRPQLRGLTADEIIDQPKLKNYFQKLSSEGIDGDEAASLIYDLPSHHDPDEIDIALEKLMVNWEKEFKAYWEVVGKKLEKSDIQKSSVNPAYAIVRDEDPEKYIDLGKIPRISDPNGIGIGGQGPPDRPTVGQTVQQRLSGENPEGFPNQYSWLIIQGFESSSQVSNPGGECQICSGQGLIAPKLVSIPIAGNRAFEDSGIEKVWQRVLDSDEDLICANCEGTGYTMPKIWLTSMPKNEDGVELQTHFELVSRIIWDSLTNSGFNPIPYDGFLTNKSDVVLANRYPIPVPNRPDINYQYEKAREGSQSVISYSIIIRLDNPLDHHDPDQLKNKFDKFYNDLQKSLKRFRLTSEVTKTPGEPESRNPALNIVGFQRQPKHYFPRKPDKIRVARNDREKSSEYKEAHSITDVEEFDKEYFKLQSEGADYIAPSWQFLKELSELQSIALDLYNQKKFHRVYAAIYSFLGQKNFIRSRMKLVESSIEESVRIGETYNYGSVLDYCISIVAKEDKDSPSMGRLESLRQKADVFNVESPGINQQDFVDLERKILGFAEDLRSSSVEQIPGVKGIFPSAYIAIYSFLNRPIPNVGALNHETAKEAVEIGKSVGHRGLLDFVIKEISSAGSEWDLWVAKAKRLYNMINNIHGSGTVPMSNVEYIAPELQNYLNTKSYIEKMKRRAIFKPKIRNIENIRDNLSSFVKMLKRSEISSIENAQIKSTEDIYPIARRINEVFRSVSESTELGFPTQPEKNPAPYLLVPIGGEIEAESLVGVDENELLIYLLKKTNWFPDPKVLAKFYWRSKIEDVPLLDLISAEFTEKREGQGTNYPDLGFDELMPNYRLVRNMAESFENDQNENPQEALIETFEKGVKLAKELYEEAGEDVLMDIYANWLERKSKSYEDLPSPWEDIVKLEFFLEGAKKSIRPKAIRQRKYRAKKLKEGHYPKSRKILAQQRLSYEFQSHYDRVISQFLKDQLAGSEEEYPASVEVQILGCLKKLVRVGQRINSKYNEYLSLINNNDNYRFIKSVAPIFQNYLSRGKDKGITVDLGNLIHPGSESDFATLKSALTRLDNLVDTYYDGNQIYIMDPEASGEFFDSLLKLTPEIRE